MMDAKSLAALCTGLSDAFSYPTRALPSLAFAAALAADGVQPPDAAETPTLEALQVEHTRLFINSLPEVPCPPYGSIYLEGCCMSGSTVAIGAVYRRLGIESDELPDHIAVEFEFLSLLLPAVDVVTQDQRADVGEIIRHLAAWTPQFFARVREHDRSGFYRSAAETGKETIALLRDYAEQTMPAPTAVDS